MPPARLHDDASPRPAADPLLRRAFGAWRRFPMWAAAAAIAVAAWLAATVTAPLTTDAAADRSFAAEADLAADAAPGRGIDARATTAGLDDDALLGDISELLDSLEVYGDSTATVSPLEPYSGSVPPAPYVRAATTSVRALVYARDGLTGSLDVVVGSPTSGVLLPDTLAEELGAAPGDAVELGLEYPSGSGFGSPPPVTAAVAGIYRTVDGVPVVDGAVPAWQLPADPVGEGTAALVITDRPTALSLLAGMSDRPFITWDMTFDAEVDIEQGRDAAASIRSAQRQFRDPDAPMARRVADAKAREVELVSAVGVLVDRSEQAAFELGPVISAITVTARVVSAGTLMMAVSLLCRARRRELDLATTIGVPPWRIALLTTVEMALPVTVGAIAAYAMVRWTPNLVAGDGHIDTGTIGAALRRLRRWFPAGFLAVAATALAAAWGTDTAGRSRARALAAALDPLTILTVAAIATGAQLATQTGPALESGSSLLFPTIAILAAAVGAARAAARLARRTGRRTTRHRSPGRRQVLWFAARRVRASIVELTTLFVVITAGVGLFVYDASVSRSADAGVGDKAAALGAAPTVASIETTDELASGADGFPVDLPPGTTVVWRSTFLPAGRNSVDLLAVDPATFADAVEWRASFAEEPLDDLLADIEDSDAGGIDVILAGNYNDNFEDSGTVSIVGAPSPITYRVVARIAAGPWQRLRAPMMIADARALAPLLGSDPVFVFDDPTAIPDAASAANLDRLLPTHVWSQLPPADVAAAIPSARFDPELADLAGSEREPGFVAVLLSLPYLELIGAALLGVSLIAVIVLGSRRRDELAVELAISGQMGVPRRTMLLAAMVAAAGVAALAAVVGVTVAALLVRVMTGLLDPAPEFPPRFAGEIAWWAVAVASASVVAAAVLGAWIDHAGARRRPVSEVLRGAD